LTANQQAGKAATFPESHIAGAAWNVGKLPIDAVPDVSRSAGRRPQNAAPLGSLPPALIRENLDVDRAGGFG
jgi:hypothetical protein